jgi:hypothetical protein
MGDDDVFYLFLQKQKIALRHIPFGYSPQRNKEAHVVVQWWFFVPFGKRGRVLDPYRLTTLSAHLYK